MEYLAYLELNHLILKCMEKDKENRLFPNLTNSLPSGPLIIISTEGHRSEYGSLLPAEMGSGYMMKKIKSSKDKRIIDNGFFIPVEITFENGSVYSGYMN